MPHRPSSIARGHDSTAACATEIVGGACVRRVLRDAAARSVCALSRRPGAHRHLQQLGWRPRPATAHSSPVRARTRALLAGGTRGRRGGLARTHCIAPCTCVAQSRSRDLHGIFRSAQSSIEAARAGYGRRQYAADGAGVAAQDASPPHHAQPPSTTAPPLLSPPPALYAAAG